MPASPMQCGLPHEMLSTWTRKKSRHGKEAILGVHYPDAVYAEYETGRQGEFQHRPRRQANREIDDRVIGASAS